MKEVFIMVNYKTIITLYYSGVSQRQISSRLRCSRNSVSSIISATVNKGLTLEMMENMSDNDVEKFLFPEKEFISSYQQPDFDYCHKELMKVGVTLSLLYDEYVAQCMAQHKPYYKRSYFFKMYSQHVSKNNLTMHITHKPADKMMVDWAGTTMEVHDSYTGEVVKAYLFVATLPFSMYSYVQACPTMTTNDWIDCHINAFEFFDGVARLLIPDNLKTGVISNKKGEDPIINKTYQEMADHYGITIIPTRVRKPRDKAAVEGTVGVITNSIIGKLRNRKFFSFEALNEAIRIELDNFNASPFQKKEGSRLSIFEDEEKDFLRPLPEKPYELSTWKIATVQLNYHIQIEKMNYSVPYEYVGKKVDVKITKDNIEVYYSGTYICTHKRLYGKVNRYSTKEDHMPKNHQAFQWNGDRLINWAKSIGPNTEEVITKHLKKYKVEEQAYKGCISILKLSDKYTAARLEDASKVALKYISNPVYKNIKLILESEQDKAKQVEEINDESMEHAIVRGTKYYER